MALSKAPPSATFHPLLPPPFAKLKHTMIAIKFEPVIDIDPTLWSTSPSGRKACVTLPVLLVGLI